MVLVKCERVGSIRDKGCDLIIDWSGRLTAYRKRLDAIFIFSRCTTKHISQNKKGVS